MSGSFAERAGAPASSDAWPHTRRVLPWSLAGILVMIYLVPFDAITLPVHLPVDSELDRFVLGGVSFVWLVIALAGHHRPTFRSSPMNSAIALFVLIVALSFGFNLRPLAWDGEMTFAVKNLSLLASFVVLFYICATTIKPDEVRPYAKFVVFLGCLTAIGTIYEYDTGVNVFFSLARALFGEANVNSSISAAYAATSVAISARPTVNGPTGHGLADCTIMSAAIPIALAFAASAERRREVAMYLAAAGLLLGGNVATGRKTGLLVPLASLVVLLMYEPRTYARFLPLLLVAFAALEIAAPTAISRLLYQVAHASGSNSTTTRVSDFGAIQPYVLSHLLIGRGYGSFDPFKYRILDNEMLDLLVTIGVLGVLAWASIVVSAMLTAHRAAKTTLRNRRLMHAISAFVLGFFVSNFTYDTFAFRQAPYIFFFLSALAVVQLSGESDMPSSDDHVRADAGRAREGLPSSRRLAPEAEPADRIYA